MLMLPTVRVFTPTSRAISTVLFTATILSITPRASQGYNPCNYETTETSSRRHVEQELRGQGRITSPSYPDAFPPCAQGMWTLWARPNCTVMLKFVEFDVANFTDRLYVYDEDYAPRIAVEITGEATNRTLQLDASNVQLLFLSQAEDPLKDGRQREVGSAPRRRFVIDFTSRPMENGSKSEQRVFGRNGESPDAPPATELSSSEANSEARKTSKLLMTVFVAVATLVFSAITLGAVYCILWRRTGHLFSYRRFFGNTSSSTAELRSDSVTSTAQRETALSPAMSTVNSGYNNDAMNVLDTEASRSASPSAQPPPPSSPNTMLATASV